MSYETPTTHPRAAARIGTRARRGHAAPTHTAEDSVELVSHVAGLFKWYREGFLGSTFGGLVQRTLVNKDDRFSRVKKTGDLGELVDLR